MVQSQEEEAGSQAFDVILYLFVLGPAVEWCLKSPRVNRGQPGSLRGMALALASSASPLRASRRSGRDNRNSGLGLAQRRKKKRESECEGEPKKKKKKEKE